MNTVCIKYTYISRKAEITINDENISSYSELSSCLNMELHICVDRIISLLDEEIYDDYTINLCGYEFQYEILKTAAKKSDFCKDVTFKPIQSISTLDNVLIFCYNMSEKYKLNNEYNENLCIYDKTSSVALADNANVRFVSETDEYDVLIVNSENEANEVKCRTIVVIGDTLNYANKKGHTYITISLKLLDCFIKYMVSVLIKVPYIERIIDELKYVSVTEQDKIEIEAYCTNIPQYFLADFTTRMDVNDIYELDFKVFPDGYSDFYKINIENSDIACLTNNRLQALKAGETTLSIVNKDGNIVETRNLQVNQHTYIEEIQLVPSFDFLRVNEKNRIDIFTSPEKAEDSAQLKWDVSDKDILRVREDGSVAALKPGTCTITVSGKKTAASLKIEVKPMAESLQISPRSVYTVMGKTETLHCNLYPANAIKGTIKWQLDNNMLGTITTANNGETCYFTAGTSAIGTGNLHCSLSGTNISTSCPVTVQKLNMHGGLLAITIFCLIFCLWPISLPLSILGRVLTGGEAKGFNVCIVLNILMAIVTIIIASMS